MKNYQRNKDISLDCPHQCETCTEDQITKSQCTECLDKSMYPPECYFPQLGYLQMYDGETETYNYLECDPKCNNCDGEVNICIAKTISGHDYEKCAGTNRDSEDNCECKKGFYDNEGNLQDCIKCPDGCLACESASRCTECDSSKFLEQNVFTGECHCPLGYREKEDGIGCEKCYQLSDACVTECPENTGKDEQNRVCQTIAYDTSSNASLILILGLLIGLVQVSLCCSVYACLQKKHKAMEKELHDEQMKIKQQRNHIYKNMENYNSDHSKSQSQTADPKSGKNKNKMEEESQDLSQSHLQSSQMNLFQRENSRSHIQLHSNNNLDLDDVSSNENQQQNLSDNQENQDSQELNAGGGGRRRKRRQI
ncbi:Insulin-like growth factor binding protein, N-terminal [Pseudocohnilembus persalinus]|uniref:Insulin-like growth factor binding protein, N-terminal n=1 Tax=Pseudocohnilembus persalinus TaxID=266149 RepID=A0A0V0QTQ6_PSEPJ|nr:Insulin-like growth factor binding protein, N-terminal [Pseudocohnilembus persalinus]|eukprot:KRX05370.1 Insulin-like growth factor binding protein, N-terminal [Pseudocohnilembus persalinus]